MEIGEKVFLTPSWEHSWHRICVSPNTDSWSLEMGPWPLLPWKILKYMWLIVWFFSNKILLYRPPWFWTVHPPPLGSPSAGIEVGTNPCSLLPDISYTDLSPSHTHLLEVLSLHFQRRESLIKSLIKNKPSGLFLTPQNINFCSHSFSALLPWILETVPTMLPIHSTYLSFYDIHNMAMPNVTFPKVETENIGKSCLWRMGECHTLCGSLPK